MEPEIYYLDKKDVLSIHEQMLEEFGGLPGIKEENKMESILAQPSGSFGGYDYFPTLFTKAAAYLFYFATGHSFIDANKRTGFMSAWTFLLLNGYNVIVDKDVAYRFILRVVCLGESKDGKPPRMSSMSLIEETSDWLEYHAKPISLHDIE